MGKQQEKLIERLLTRPTDFTWDEVRKIFGYLGYIEDNKGKTSGSRVAFVLDAEPKDMILLHRPHGGDPVDPGALKFIIQHLKEREKL